MGQRTQLVVEVTKVTEDYSTKKKTKKTYVGSYHNQWGIGKMQLWDVMRFLTTYVDSMEEGFTFPEKLYKGWLLNGNEYEHPFKGKATPERVMKWINTTQDNNNGGMLLKVEVDKYNYLQSGKLYIFNDPEREYSRYCDQHPNEDVAWENFKVSRVVRFVEYMNYDPIYFSGDDNEAFISSFLSLLRYCHIEIVQPKQKDED